MKDTLFTYSVLLLSSILAASCGGGDGGGGGSIACGDNDAVYVRMDADDSNRGTLSAPLRTIQTAVDCAVPGQDIRVANGTYNSSIGNLIYLTEGKSIYGGYSSNYQVRDPAIYPTIIADVTDISDVTDLIGDDPFYIVPLGIYTVLTKSNTTPATVLDGFTINGSAIDYYVHVSAIYTYGSPTISNNIINAGGSNLANRSLGIAIINGGPVIKNNTINGGNPSWSSEGITGVTDGALISNNIIDSGTGGDWTYGILIGCLANVTTIRNNSITGGGGEGGSHGIFVNDYYSNCSVIMEANTIASGTSRTKSEGIWSFGDGETIIRNNTIVLEGVHSSGISASSNGVISNNTIVGGGSDFSVGIDISYFQTEGLAIQNNIIDLINGTCINEYNDSNDPVALKNNDLTGCATVYLDEVTINITNIDDVNALSDTDASGNVSTPPNLDSAQDYRLTGVSPIAVTQGGLDLSSDFNTDKAGILRTVPWSMGAYEYD